MTENTTPDSELQELVEQWREKRERISHPPVSGQIKQCADELESLIDDDTRSSKDMRDEETEIEFDVEFGGEGGPADEIIANNDPDKVFIHVDNDVVDESELREFIERLRSEKRARERWDEIYDGVEAETKYGVSVEISKHIADELENLIDDDTQDNE